MGVAALIAGGMYAATTFLGPKAPNAIKGDPFECGNASDGARNLRPSVKFYLTAILFVVFDIEAVFLYPWGGLFRDLGWLGFVEMLSFLLVLSITLVYAWKKGALEWEN